MHWHLILEEFGPYLTHIPGKVIVVADALSHLPFDSNNHLYSHYIAEAFGVDEIPKDAFPLTQSYICKFQHVDKSLLSKVQHDNQYTRKSFCGVGKECFSICRNDKICLPVALQELMYTGITIS